MKWDIDEKLAQLENDTGAAGTMITRCIMDVDLMTREGVKPTAAQRERGHGNIWCIAVGRALMPKAMFYGQTIRTAFLKALKTAKSRKGLRTPWGEKIELRAS